MTALADTRVFFIVLARSGKSRLPPTRSLSLSLSLCSLLPVSLFPPEGDLLILR